MARSVFSVGWPQAVERAFRVDVGAGHVNSADRGHRSNVGIEKRWADDRSNQMSVTVTSDGRCVAVSNSESWHALLSRPQH